MTIGVDVGDGRGIGDMCWELIIGQGSDWPYHSPGQRASRRSISAMTWLDLWPLTPP